MDYVVGSVAALISGNVTPSRPKLIRRALTPTKHQPSPNVTPKSEFVEDRSIFLSPTQQKKQAIVKKSPKRIFENPDLDATEDSEGNSTLPSPKAEKVKKHLKDELESEIMEKKKSSSPKSHGNKLDEVSQKKKSKIVDDSHENDSTPKKKNKKHNFKSEIAESKNINEDNDNTQVEQTETSNITGSNNVNSPKKMKQRRKSIADTTEKHVEEEVAEISKSPNKQKKPINNEIERAISQDTFNNQIEKKKKKKCKKKKQIEERNVETLTIEDKENNDQDSSELNKQILNKKKNKNRKNKPKKKQISESQEVEKLDVDVQSESETEEVKSKNIPNPNAITEKDTDSEHDSDDEIESENEQKNEKLLKNEVPRQEESSDEEEKKPEKNKKKEKKAEEKTEVMSEEEIKRTLFVGNVPFSNKCKKEIKKIFSKYGQIDTIRIRTIPVKDARVTPKLAVIKNELHPERTTVNVYVKYADAASVSKALTENNTTLNGCHLRVSRSDSTGAEHDPRCAVFVGNLPFGIEDETLRSKFEDCGEIASVRIIRDKKTNAGKGFGFVNFASKDGVELALALSEESLTVKNRIIRVKRCAQAQSQGKRTDGGGKFDRGGKFKSGPKYDSGRNFGAPAKWGDQSGQEAGAARRLMHKRKQQESGDGPPNKKQNVNQLNKEKKPRKEFVGMTAEKKKKQKFNKGQKKKKALSEILTKKA